jgi:hypothetical protein
MKNRNCGFFILYKTQHHAAVYQYIEYTIVTMKLYLKTVANKVENFTSRDDRDAMLRASYYILTKNFTKTINRFVVFQDGKEIVQIPHGIGQRSRYIDMLIKYFEELEEYEKCSKLAKLRAEVIEFGD